MIQWDKLSEAYHYLQNASAHIYDFTAAAWTIYLIFQVFLELKCVC